PPYSVQERKVGTTGDSLRRHHRWRLDNHEVRAERLVQWKAMIRTLCRGRTYEARSNGSEIERMASKDLSKADQGNRPENVHVERLASRIVPKKGKGRWFQHESCGGYPRDFISHRGSQPMHQRCVSQSMCPV